MDVKASEFFREVTLRICGSLDIDEAMGEAFEYIREVIPADGMGLLYFDFTNAHLGLVARAASSKDSFLWDEDALEESLPQEYISFVKAQPVKTSHSWWIVNDPLEMEEVVLRLLPRLKSNSALGVHLGLQGEDIGILVVSASGVNRYTEENGKLLESVKEPFAIAMSNARRYRDLLRVKELLAEDNRALSNDLKRVVGEEVIGADFGLREVMEQVRQIAKSLSPALLLGETGTGKEVIANAIHQLSPRQKGPMISMQCGAIPESLLDSELFGHERGAFTGALERKRGRFERADGGTLFLDEIGELSLEAQVKLLRVLQEKRFERVGGTQTIEANVRVIAATHRDLEKMVREGTFREDLWYRLNVLPIRIPPLRLRRDDIPSLVRYFVQRKSQEMNLAHTPLLDSEELERLKTYNWPGNVRELQNIVERALILSQGERLHFPVSGPVSRSLEPLTSAKEPEEMLTMNQTMARQIRRTLKRTKGRIEGDYGAAKILDMNPGTLRFRMKKLGIQRTDFYHKS
jgi:transcriptional regulator with GAF, ATPase, and Fis domain